MDIVEKISSWAGWVLLTSIAFVTLSPIGLRPRMASPEFERFGAFAALGFLFAVGFPRHIHLVLTLVVGAAVVLEVGQLIVPTRHGEFADAIAKILGGLAGIGCALAVTHALR